MSISSNSLVVKTSYVCNCFPIILCTVTSIVEIFQKIIVDCLKYDVTQMSPYYRHLKQKNYLHCLILAVPFGIFIVALLNRNNRALGEQKFLEGKVAWEAQRENEAIDILKEAVKHGSANAQYYLAGCYENQNDETKKKDIATLYMLAADQNHPAAIYSLGVEYEKGVLFSKDEEETFRLFTTSAALGCDQAINELQKPKWKNRINTP